MPFDSSGWRAVVVVCAVVAGIVGIEWARSGAGSQCHEACGRRDVDICDVGPSGNVTHVECAK
jgi:hypothetical protein